MTVHLSPGTLCAVDDRVVAIDGADSLTHVHVRELATGRSVRVEIAKLRPLPTSVAKQTSADLIPADEWKRCSTIAALLAPYAGQRSMPRAELEAVAKAHGLSLRQVQRLRKKFATDPKASALARATRGRAAGSCQLAPAVHDVVMHVIRKHWFRSERPTKAHIVDRAQSLCRRLNLTPPSRNAILRRIDGVNGYEADLKRLGAKAAKQIWEPRPGRLTADGALGIVQIDHTRVDVMVRSEDRQTVIGRPWITLAIDVSTRVVLGFYLTMDAPSSVSVSMCIEHAVLPKAEEREQSGMWPMYGKPRCILVDNGKDLRSHALKRGCEQHSIKLKWRPVRRPHYGAHIERLNGTLMKLCHLLPGTTFSNPRERGDYDSEAKAIMTLRELRAWLVEKICRYYHVRSHRGIGMAPLVAWQKAFTDEHGQIRPPPLVADPHEFRVDFLPYVFRNVTRNGIEFRSRYWHEELRELINRPEQAMVRYDPSDARCVWVRMPNKLLLEIPAVAGVAAGDASKRAVIDPSTKRQLDAAIDAHFERCDAIEAEAARATRVAKRKSAKATPRTPPPPPPPAFYVVPTPPRAKVSKGTPKPTSGAPVVALMQAVPTFERQRSPAATAPREPPVECGSDIAHRDQVVTALHHAPQRHSVAQPRPTASPDAGRLPGPPDIVPPPLPLASPVPPPLRAPVQPPLPVEDWT